MPMQSAQKQSGRMLKRRSTYTCSMRVFIVSLFAFITSVIIVYCSITFVAFPLKYRGEIEAAGAEFGVDPVLVASVIKTESRFRAGAVSPRGAVGLMQVMPSTAEFVAEKYDLGEFDLYNPHDNIRIGTCYLRYLFDRFGDTRTVLAAYNAGPGNVARWAVDGRVETTPFPETNKYVEKVLDARGYYRWRLKNV